MDARHRILATLLAFFVASAVVGHADEAHADFVGVWVRGDGSFISGTQEGFRFFESNDAGLAYGMAAGAELMQIDLFMDLNFFPGGEMFNLLGLGFDIDLLPVGGVNLAPAVQVAYFYGGHADDDALGDKGFLGRAGAQFEVELFPTIWLGADAFAGGAFTYGPEKETGFVFSSSLYLIFQLTLL